MRIESAEATLVSGQDRLRAELAQPVEQPQGLTSFPLRISAVGDGSTVVEVSGEVTSSIPLVGGRLADFVGGDVKRTLAAEEEFNDRHLAERS